MGATCGRFVRYYYNKAVIVGSEWKALFEARKAAGAPTKGGRPSAAELALAAKERRKTAASESGQRAGANATASTTGQVDGSMPAIDAKVLGSGDVGLIHSSYHNLYLQMLHERQASRKAAPCGSEWEDNCFVCKDGGNLVCCEYGHEKQPGDRVPCCKAYHMECLGSTSEPPNGWCCPRHQCGTCAATLAAGGQSSGQALAAVCYSCRNSYCQAHVPPNARTLSDKEAPPGGSGCAPKSSINPPGNVAVSPRAKVSPPIVS